MTNSKKTHRYSAPEVRASGSILPRTRFCYICREWL